MKKLDLKDFELIKSEGVFTLKNLNTTLGFVRFNEIGEIEYIFVNPIFRKKGLAKKLLKLVKEKTRKMINVLTFADSHKNKTNYQNTFSNLEDWKSKRVFK